MSVKVAVRVRPFNEREINMAQSEQQDLSNINDAKQLGPKCCIKMEGPTTSIIDPFTGQARPYTFDYSFWSHDQFKINGDGYTKPDGPLSVYADQQFVYKALGEQVLDNAWQGYHCCLFAYGQTGSGKSYSMIGHGKNEGIVPIACNEIFKRIKTNQNPNLKFEVQISMLEIYNEKIQDLLVNNSVSQSLKVRELKKGEVYVHGLSKHPVDSYKTIAKKMEEGYTNRSIGATLMNQTSSRAHTIITIEFKQIIEDEMRKTEKLSIINLVDLAGSEKAGQTGAEGQRLKEGCAINKSLTVLGNCISVLAEKCQGKAKTSVVPYRDSNLTRILQNALGGNSKTIMICAISPASINYEESLSTLRYAERAKKIMNRAVVNESGQEKIIRELKEENEKLKQILMQAARDGVTNIDLSNFNLDLIDFSKIQLGENGSQTRDALEIVEQMKEAEKQIEELEKPWEQRLQEQREKDELEKQKQQKMKQLMDKRVPHLTNLNEDLQLTGKMCYSLLHCQDNNSILHIGRHDGEPTPQIILRGFGIQKNHAYIRLLKNGMFQIYVNSKESLENTLVNGKRLLKQDQLKFNEQGNHKWNQQMQEILKKRGIIEEQIYSATLNHLDRIFIGVNTIFVFKYPLQKLKFEKIKQLVKNSSPYADEDEIEQKCVEKLQIDGVTTQLEQLICTEEDYSEEMIQNDNNQMMDFDRAYEEATFEEKLNKRKQIEQQLQSQQKALEKEKVILEEKYQKKLNDMQENEQKRIQNLILQQKQLEDELKNKEQNMRKIEQASAQQLQEQQIRAQKDAANKVDKIEVEKLQDRLKQVQEEIERQKIENQIQIAKEKEEIQKKFQQKEEKIKRKKDKMLFELSSLAQEIKEANQICEMMEKNVKFKQCYVQVIINKEIEGKIKQNDSDSSKDSQEEVEKCMKQEMQVCVQNNDKKIMWSVEQFQDKLIMLRDSLHQYEDQKQQKAQREIEKQLKKEQKLKMKEKEANDQLDSLRSSIISQSEQTKSTNINSINQDNQFMDGIFDDAAKIEDEIFGQYDTKKNDSFISNSSESSLNSNNKLQKIDDNSIDSFSNNIDNNQIQIQQNQMDNFDSSSQNSINDNSKALSSSSSSGIDDNPNLKFQENQQIFDYNIDKFQQQIDLSVFQSDCEIMREEQMEFSEILPQNNSNQKQDSWNKDIEYKPLQSSLIEYDSIIEKKQYINELNPLQSSLLSFDSIVQSNQQPQNLQKQNKPLLIQSNLLIDDMQIVDNNDIESKDKNEIAQVLFDQFQNASQQQMAQTIESLSPDILQLLLEKIQTMNDQLNSLKIDAIKNMNSKENVNDKQVEGLDHFQSIFGKSSEFEKQKILAQQLQELIYYEQKKRNDLKTQKLIQQIQLYQSNGIDETEIFKQDEEDIEKLVDENHLTNNIMQSSQNKIQVIKQTTSKQSVKVLNNGFPIYYNRDFNPQKPITDKTVIKMKQQFLMRLTGHKTSIIDQARLFMLPIPIEFGQIQCSIERKNSGLNKIWPKYYLHLSGHNVIMLESKKLKTSKTPHFRIEIKGSSSGFLQSNQQFYLGKLNSNLSYSEFYMYDYGIKPKDAKAGEVGYLRRQYGTIIYGTMNLQDKILRKLSVYLPMIDPRVPQLYSWPDNDLKKNNIPFEYAQQLMMNAKQQLKQEEQKTIERQEKNKIPQIMLFQSVKNDKTTNYNGRVTQPSKKNFQLSDEFDQSKIYLQFGRNGKNTFNIDVAYPFSIYQAFCVCLSTFDYKISAK